MHIALPFLVIFLLLSGCSSSSSPDPRQSFETPIAGEWTNDALIRGGRVVSITWSFNSMEFVKTTRFVDAPAELLVETGTFVFGTSVVMTSGVNAYKLDITFNKDNPSENPTTELDVAYINADLLYFGKPIISESCEGDVYQKPSLSFEVVNGVIRTLDIDESTCFARPDTIDFDNPYLLSQS